MKPIPKTEEQPQKFYATTADGKTVAERFMTPSEARHRNRIRKAIGLKTMWRNDKALAKGEK